MKSLRRSLALLLSFCLVFSLLGCGKEAQPSSSETEPAESPAVTAYTQARTPVEQADSLTLRINTTKSTTVGGETFTEKTAQVLCRTADEAGNILYSSDETVTYSNSSSFYCSVTYYEIFADGTMYVTMDSTDQFRGEVTAEEYAQRFAPAVLLDAALYGDVTQEGSVLAFSAPTAAESWAMPEGAELVDASGTALLSDSGELQKTTYSLTYTYGPARITLDVEVYPTIEPVTVDVPDSADAYTLLEYADAPRLSAAAFCYLREAQNIQTSSLESTLSQAGGFILNQSTTLNEYGTGADYLAKVETNVFIMDSSTSQQYEQEELFRDGKYTVTQDDGEPQELTNVSSSLMEDYCGDLLSDGFISYQYWQEATAWDLGSLYLLELTFTQDWGDSMQDEICSTYFGSASLLNDLAESYVTNETSGYLAIDKYTGLPTAAGFYYEGAHTIDGEEYLLRRQMDYSMEAPALGAYYEITEEMLPEEEPETKATPLFYHVTGPDGQEMWLFGTIHVGDERTAYLPQEIYDALSSSDALALEYYSDRFDEQYEEDEDLQDQVSDAYFYSDGTTTADHLDQELYDLALRYLKAVGGYNMNSEYMKPYLWSQQIDNFYLRQGYQLTNDQGVENRLEIFAEEHEIEIRDVESALFQIRMMTGWSDELQALLLEGTLENDPMSSWEGTMELYELWCAGDEAAMREQLSDEVDTSEMTEEELAEYQEQLPYIEEYNKSMSYDRNDGMLEVAISYLESGDTVFFAVGLAHLLNNVNGLVDALRDAGYTVELVEYAN